MGFFKDIALASDFEEDTAKHTENEMPADKVVPDEEMYSFTGEGSESYEVPDDDSDIMEGSSIITDNEEPAEEAAEDAEESVEVSVKEVVPVLPPRKEEKPKDVSKKDKKSPFVKTDVWEDEGSVWSTTVVSKNTKTLGIEGKERVLVDGICEGNITTEGDVSVRTRGTVKGDIHTKGNVVIHGNVSGGVIEGKDIRIETRDRLRIPVALINGESVSISENAVVIGDIRSESLTVAGAVKGDIDIKGPVVLLATAVVQGNVKAASIQMETGALVDGNCSLAYRKVDLASYFDEKNEEGLKEGL
jgi:cytoskeletal protein CcmA (bactofilin family)